MIKSNRINREAQIHMQHISSRALVNGLDFFSSKSIGTMCKNAKRTIKMPMQISFIPPNNRNRYFKRKNSYNIRNGVMKITLLVLKLIDTPNKLMIINQI